MARNGSGTMAILNSFSTGGTIEAGEHNANNTDIAAEITNSVAKDGQTTMTGQLKLDNGTVSAPAMTFGSDLNTGIYRIGADNLGIGVGGSKVIDVGAAGATIVGVGTVTSLAVVSNDGGAIGASGTAFSDLFLASGGVINWNAGNATLTHSASLLTSNVAFSIGTSNALTAGTIELGHASANTLSASGGVLSIEGNAVYHAGGTDVPVPDGGTGASSASSARTNLGVAYASQANMEALAATAVVIPSVQHHHPGHAKAVCAAASDGTIAAGEYGVDTVAKTGTGVYRVTVDTAVSNAMPFATAYGTGGALSAVAQVNPISTTVFDVYTVRYGSSGAVAVDAAFSFMVFGDHA